MMMMMQGLLVVLPILFNLIVTEASEKGNESIFVQNVSELIKTFCTDNKYTLTKCAGSFYTELIHNVHSLLDSNHITASLLSTKPLQAWLYSLGGATLVLVLSLGGALLLGFSKSIVINYIIMTIQAFAVGVLSGNALIHLIPDGLGLDEFSQYDYTWKSFVSAITVVLFCATDAIIRLYGSWMGGKRLPKYSPMDGCTEGHSKTSSTEKNTTESPCEGAFPIVPSSANIDHRELDDSWRVNCFGTKVESQGIMIIIGDMLHNFIDGLAIGVSFAASTTKGWSTMVAVIAEEVPHEIGDMTILVGSGFSLCKAIIWNFISCLTCHVGVVVALSLGDLNKHAKDYIEMICGGAFLYISFMGVYPHVMELSVQLANNNLRRYQLNMVLIFTMIIAGQAFMGGVSYLE